MIPLLVGLVLFLGVHLLLGIAPKAIADLRGRLGPNAVKGLMALLSASGIALIVVGWRSAQTTWLYTTGPELRHGAMLLIAVAIYLFVVSSRPSVIKCHLRHPQLTGVLLWALGHLLANGDSRSLILFGALGAWAILEMLLINRRDGAWLKPPAPPLTSDLLTAVVAVIAIIALAWAHPWFTGVPVIPAVL